jgi:hypothetical protein
MMPLAVAERRLARDARTPERLRDAELAAPLGLDPALGMNDATNGVSKNHGLDLLCVAAVSTVVIDSPAERTRT